MVDTENNNELEYFLGKGRSEDFLIIEHMKESTLMVGISRIDISENWMGEGGHYEYFDGTFVNICKKDYLNNVRQLQNIGKELYTLGYAKGIRLKRPILSGDYVFQDGLFMNVEYISRVDDICRIKLFYFDGEVIGIYADSSNQERWSDFIEENGIEEISNRTLLITEEVYNEALNIAKDSFTKIRSSIEELYQSKQKK